MNKSISLLLALIAATILFAISSCVKKAGSSEGSEDAQKVDTIWNEKIQDTFFGVKFGAPRQEVIDSLTAHDFTMYTGYSDNKSRILFYPSSTKRFSFGGILFSYIHANFNDEKFESIEFSDTWGENKQAKRDAVEKAKIYKNALAGKYELTKTIIDKDDSASVFYKSAVFAKNGTIIVGAFRRQTVGGEDCYISKMVYVSKAVSEEPNKEL